MAKMDRDSRAPVVHSTRVDKVGRRAQITLALRATISITGAVVMLIPVVWMGMTAGGPGDATELIALNLYRQAFLGQWRTGRASALAYIILIIIIGVSNVYIRYLNKIKEG